MKKVIPALLIVALYSSSCGDSKNEPQTDVPEQILPDAPEQSSAVTDAPHFWSADADSAGVIAIRKVRPITNDSLNAETMLEYFNSIYPEIKLQKEKQSGDTLFLGIKDSRFLTNQMGSTGAFNYLQEVTYNFTEIRGINYLHFNFKEGDHAEPGYYDRSKFVTGL